MADDQADAAPPEAAKPEATQASTSPVKKPTSPFLTGLVSALLTGVLGLSIGGGYAWYSERQAGNARVAAIESDIGACEDREHSLELQLREARKATDILKVRVDLSRALDELAKRNFWHCRRAPQFGPQALWCHRTFSLPTGWRSAREPQDQP